MHKLIITEKPSVAYSISAVLGATQRRTGYLEGNNYLVSWCLGHLADLAEPEAYDKKYAKWRVSDLPIVPDTWRFQVDAGKQKQFNILRDLMNRPDVGEIINACDAGREGELIFRTVYELAGCTKPVKRLWISSMEDAAIREGFQNLRPGSDYDGLYQAALCRAKADWLVGINATRLFSVLYHRTLNVGRVLSPTLALVTQRESEIASFTPKLFYTVELQAEDLLASTGKVHDKATAQAIVTACQGKTAVVRSVERKEKQEKPPTLYDLTTLQRDANRLLGYTARQTLDLLQQLYERKLVTYPRTDSRFLTDDMAEKIPSLLPIAAAICGEKAPSTYGVSQVCDSQRVSDHHAIIPTVAAGSANLSALSTEAYEILQLVARRLLCATSEAHRYIETAASIECGGYLFTAKGRKALAPGWKVYVSQDQLVRTQPELMDGQTVEVEVLTIKEGKTTPPSHFTEDTLLASMESAGAKEMPDDAERKGLGTPATRAAILEKLVAGGFIERQKSRKSVQLIPTHTGTSLSSVLPEQLRSPLLTAEWEQRLKQVERGELSPDAFMEGITEMVWGLVKTYTPVENAEVLFPSGRKVIGKCPRCGGNVTESKSGFFCESNDCRFGLWRDNRFLTAKQITLTRGMAAALLKDRRAHLPGATLVLKDNGEQLRYGLVPDHA